MTTYCRYLLSIIIYCRYNYWIDIHWRITNPHPYTTTTNPHLRQRYTQLCRPRSSPLWRKRAHLCRENRTVLWKGNNSTSILAMFNKSPFAFGQFYERTIYSTFLAVRAIYQDFWFREKCTYTWLYYIDLLGHASMNLLLLSHEHILCAHFWCSCCINNTRERRLNTIYIVAGNMVILIN